MQIGIGTTKKRVNSTSQVFEDIDYLDVRLKNGTSIHDPVFIVQGLTHAKMYNFCKYGNFYYWIDDITYLTNDLFEVSCHLDPLATYKTRIYDVNALVTFGDNDHRNPIKDDNRFGPDFKLDRSAGVGVDSVDIGFTSNLNNWTIIITAQHCTSLSYSGVNTYAMSWSTFVILMRSFTGVVNSDIQSWSTSDIIDIIKNYAIRLLTGGQQALDNIRAAIAVPIPLTVYQSIAAATLSTFALGPYSFSLEPGHNVYLINSGETKTGNGVLSLGRPVVNGAYQWLNLPKYCSVKITHPCGYQEINDPSLITKNQLYVWYSLGLCSGDYAIRVTSENTKDSDTIALLTGVTGVSILSLIPASNMTMDSNLHNSIDSLVMGALGQQFNPGSAGPSRHGAEAYAGFAGVNLLTEGKACFLDTEYYYPSVFTGGQSTDYVSFCSEYGHPVDKYLRVGDIKGYCQCANANIGKIEGATEQDKININTYLNTGIYIEF